MQEQIIENRVNVHLLATLIGTHNHTCGSSAMPKIMQIQDKSLG